MKALAIGLMNLRRLFRDRIGVFFFLIFPFLLILAIGAVFGSGFTPALGVVSRGGGPLGSDLVRRLGATADIELRAYDGRETLTKAVERGHVEAGLVIVDGYDERLRSGQTLTLPFIARPAGEGAQLGLTVDAVLAEQATEIRAARFLESEGLTSLERGLALARTVGTRLPRVHVDARVAGGDESIGDFDYGAAQELILFVFVNSLAASSMLIQSRKLGASRRMLASPTPAGTILVGEGLGRFAIAFTQGVLIFLGTLLLFGVDWGDPASGIAIIVLFSLVGTGAAMLMGSALHNEEQAGGLGVFIGLGFAALGGCMVPIDLFPPVMVTIAHVTPHAWAMDGFDEILRRGGTIADILPELGMLAAFAAVLLTVASAAFRRRLTSPAASA